MQQATRSLGIVAQQIAFTLVFVFAMSTCAQQATQPTAKAANPSTPVFKIESRAVTLDVVVSGKHNGPLAGLTKEDFKLLEDGKPQTIANFSAIDMQGKGTQLEQGLAPRTIIVFDEVLGNFVDLASARQELHKFFNRNNGQLAQPTMLYALTGNGLATLHGYTRDGHALGVALHKHRTYISPCYFGQCWYIYASSTSVMPVSPVEALEEIAMSEETVPTHKIIIWLTTGVPAFIPPSLLPADMQKSIFDEVRRVSEIFRRARVTLYTIDTSGVTDTHVASNQNLAAFAAPAKDSSGSTLSDLSPQTLAIQTGGEALFGRNDTENEVKESVAQGDVYYSLLYYPTNTDFNGKFRKITVSIDKPGYEVRTRDGYYAFPDSLQPLPLDIQRQLAQVARSPIDYSGIPIVLTSTKLTAPPSQASIRVYVDIRSVQWHNLPDGTRQSTVDIAAVDFAAPDKPLHAVSNLVTVTIPQPNGSQKQDRLFKVPVTLPVTLPEGYLRVVIRDDATGRIGSTDITNLKKLPVYPGVEPILKSR